MKKLILIMFFAFVGMVSFAKAKNKIQKKPAPVEYGVCTWCGCGSYWSETGPHNWSAGEIWALNNAMCGGQGTCN